MDELAKVFANVPRHLFLTDDMSSRANLDTALPIGFGQTNSQPSTVRLMLEWLEVEPGNKILDVGSGSGWTTALLAGLTGPKGKVYAVELVPELVEFGRQNNRRLAVKNSSFYQAGKSYGLPRFAPYDRILVSAAADELPQDLLNQLAGGGKMVIPVRNDILEIEKLSGGELDIRPHSGFVFVPLLSGSA